MCYDGMTITPSKSYIAICIVITLIVFGTSYLYPYLHEIFILELLASFNCNFQNALSIAILAN